MTIFRSRVTALFALVALALSTCGNGCESSESRCRANRGVWTDGRCENPYAEQGNGGGYRPSAPRADAGAADADAAADAWAEDGLDAEAVDDTEDAAMSEDVIEEDAG